MPRSHLLQRVSVNCVSCLQVRSFCVCTLGVTRGILFVSQCGGSHTPRANSLRRPCIPVTQGWRLQTCQISLRMPSRSVRKASRRFWPKKERTWSGSGQPARMRWRRRSVPSSGACVQRLLKFLPQRGSFYSLQEFEYPDPEVFNLITSGVTLNGEVECSGLFNSVNRPATMSTQQLRENASVITAATAISGGGQSA